MKKSAVKSTLCVCLVLGLSVQISLAAARRPRVEDLGIAIGSLARGPHNTITDVEGVKVGQVTLIESPHIRTGVTAILPHPGNMFQQKVPAAIYIANGFGKLMGYSQVEELGNLETPIVLTNTLSVPTAAQAAIDYTLSQPENSDVRSVNPVVGETNDGWLNDIRGRHVRPQHVLKAIRTAASGPVEEGSVGAGTGTICFGFKGGIGTASRRLPLKPGVYTVGVLVQTNFGYPSQLRIAGCPVGRELRKSIRKKNAGAANAEGSCMIVVATDAPLCARNLKRLAKRAVLGLGRTGGICSNGSGDYCIAFSTAVDNRIPYASDSALHTRTVLTNSAMSPLFQAVIEATEEAVLNSLFQAAAMTGRDGHKIETLPVDKVKEILKKYQVMK
jgi:D-aminopeptidase